MTVSASNIAPIHPSGRPTVHATASQLWDALGNIPLDRILLDPPPGAASEADVLHLQAHHDRLCELVDGTLVEKTMGFEESLVALQIGAMLLSFVRPRRLGIVSGSDGMMRILPNRIRLPDVAFISFDRLPGRKRPGVAVPELSPDLAVEVLSENNTPREMALKLEEYFAAGTRLVWYLHLTTRTIDVYTAVDHLQRLDDSMTLTGGDLLPGFEAPVAAVFDVG